MDVSSAPNVNFIAAYPKSGITFLSYMLFRALFERPDDLSKINSDYIIDVHRHLDRVTTGENELFYVKCHFAFGPELPLRSQARRAILLVRAPIDVMMSAWDYKHLTGEGNLHLMSEAVRAPLFRQFVADWISSGGRAYHWAESWVNNVNSWLDQREIPSLVIHYEALKARPAEELRRILNFLDQPVSQERLLAAVEFGDVTRMREGEERAVAAGANLFVGHEKGYRFVGRLHQNAYRTVLGDEQRDLADRVFGATIDKISKHTQPMET